MVEVFRTNVKSRDHADMLLYQIHQTFVEYHANFDLEDCDKILRIKSTGSAIEPHGVIDLLQGFGFQAEVLPNDFPPPGPILLQSRRLQMNA